MEERWCVTKKIFKKAVDRNRLKRRTREAYRINKHLFTDNKKLLIGYIYTANKIFPFNSIETSVLSSINKLSDNSINE